MDQEVTAYLELADWRRRVAMLYADVRTRAAADPAAAAAHWRAAREHLYRTHPQSPLPLHKRATFRAQYFPYDPALRFEVPVLLDAVDGEPRAGQGEPAEQAAPALAPRAAPIPTSMGHDLVMLRLGCVEIPFLSGRRCLAVFWMEGYAGGLYLPFGDATNGKETYRAGRYLLDGAKSADLGGDPASGTLILDFNFAYHPSCAFDPRWGCPLTPLENRLDLPIRAGERVTPAVQIVAQE